MPCMQSSCGVAPIECCIHAADAHLRNVKCGAVSSSGDSENILCLSDRYKIAAHAADLAKVSMSCRLLASEQRSNCRQAAKTCMAVSMAAVVPLPVRMPLKASLLV